MFYKYKIIINNKTKNVGIDNINKSYFIIFFHRTYVSKVMAKVKVFADRKMLNYIIKKEEHKNSYKTKNVGIDIIYISYFIIFFVKPTRQKLWPRLRFLLTEKC